MPQQAEPESIHRIHYTYKLLHNCLAYGHRLMGSLAIDQEKLCLFHHSCLCVFPLVLLIRVSIARSSGFFLLGLGLKSPFLCFFTSAVYLAGSAVYSIYNYCIVIYGVPITLIIRVPAADPGLF